MDIFKQARRIVRANPEEFKEAIQVITDHVMREGLSPAAIANVIYSCAEDAINDVKENRNNDIIFLCFLLTDNEVDDGRVLSDSIFSQRITGKTEDEEYLSPQEIAAGMVFAEMPFREGLQFKERLSAAVEAYNLSHDAGAFREKEGAIARSGCWHNQDYTEIVWYGVQYSFNKTQGHIIEYLWENETASQESIGKHIDCANNKYRLVDSFKNRRSGLHDAWGKIIKPVRKGVFRLVKP